MRIEPLDTGDAAAMAEFAALRIARIRHDNVDYPELDAETLTASMSYPMPGNEMEMWAARNEHGMVGFVDLVLPQRENVTGIHSEGFVHPAHRRQGIGTALYRHLQDRAKALGRTTVITSAVDLAPGGSADVDTAGARFLDRHGFKRALVEPRRRLDLSTADHAAFAALESEIATPDYEILTWRNRAEDALAADLATLEDRLHADIPTGELEWEPAAYDVERWRQLEEMGVKRGRTLYYAAARHRPSGRLAAYTGFFLPKRPRSHAWQITTVVLPQYRGNKLGLAVKLANIRHARAHEPQLRYIDTNNADDNAHMIAINAQLGFVLRDVSVDFQRNLADS